MTRHTGYCLCTPAFSGTHCQTPVVGGPMVPAPTPVDPAPGPVGPVPGTATPPPATGNSMISYRVYSWNGIRWISLSNNIQDQSSRIERACTYNNYEVSLIHRLMVTVDCEAEPNCLGGGACIELTRHTGYCVCPVTTSGVRCEMSTLWWRFLFCAHSIAPPPLPLTLPYFYRLFNQR